MYIYWVIDYGRLFFDWLCLFSFDYSFLVGNDNVVYFYFERIFLENEIVSYFDGELVVLIFEGLVDNYYFLFFLGWFWVGYFCLGFVWLVLLWGWVVRLILIGYFK